MDSFDLSKYCVQSCDEISTVLNGNASDKGMIVISIKNMTKVDDYWLLSLNNKLYSTDDIGLRIINETEKYDYYQEEESSEIRYSNYNEFLKTIDLHVSKNVDDKLVAIVNNGKVCDIKIIKEMRWLVSLTRSFYETCGELIRMPESRTIFSRSDMKPPHMIDSNGNELEADTEQKEAVKLTLSDDITYVWGAPGTGKTQFVLASSIIANIKHGNHVIIMAPTNHALDQALHGVIKIIESDDPGHNYIDTHTQILRLGRPTISFFKTHMDNCEDDSINLKIMNEESEVEAINTILAENEIGLAKESITKIENYIYTSNSSEECNNAIDAEIQSLKRISRGTDKYSTCLIDVNSQNITGKIDHIKDVFINSLKTKIGKGYEDKTTEELESKRKELLSSIKDLEKKKTSERLSDIKILAMTPYVLMGRYKLLSEKGIFNNIGHVYIDEAGYCTVIQALTAFTFGCPVTLLGDHMQLPPVSELNRQEIKGTDCGMMWKQSALYLESYLFGDLADASSAFYEEKDPTFINMRKSDLTCTHRFGTNLSTILDKYVYKNGIHSSGGNNLDICCVNVEDMNVEGRVNKNEAERLVAFLERYNENFGSFVVLTPYANQREYISNLNKQFEDDVLTIHKSQGREWDTVIISVSDNRSNASNPGHYCTSTKMKGLKVINTAISRAKMRLIIFCDYAYWKRQKRLGDLLGTIVSDSRRIDDCSFEINPSTW